MKKTAYIFLAAVMLAACAKSADPAPAPVTEIRLCGDNASGEKTAFGTVSGSKVPFIWVSGDRIGLFVKDGGADVSGASNVVAKIQATASSGFGPGYGTAFFTAAIPSLEEAHDYTLDIYYPYDDAAGTSSASIAHRIPSVQVQSASSNSQNIGLDGTFAYASAAFTTPLSVGTYSPEVGFTFNHQTSYIWVRAKAADAGTAAYKLSQITLTVPDGTSISGNAVFTPSNGSFSIVSEGSNSATVKLLDKPVLSTSAYADAYLVVCPASLAGETVTLSYQLEKSDGSEVKTVTHTRTLDGSSTAFSAGCTHRFTEEIPSADADGWAYSTGRINLAQNGTANCYIVSAAGEYSFPATVIGNGDKGILKPVSTTFFHTETATINPASAVLVWQTVPGLITDVELSGGVINFTKPSAAYGNALIAAKDGSGKILWSWHIWCTDTGAAQPWIGSSSKNVYHMMDRDLGATYSANTLLTYDTAEGIELIKRSIGMMYQWGRKDPMMPVYEISASSSTSQFTTMYDIAGNVVARPASVSAETISSYGAIKSTIENPTTTYFGTTNTSKDWFSDKGSGTGPTKRAYYLWGNPQGYNYNHATNPCTPVKTIYDPCPPGWMVPGGDIFTSLYSLSNGDAGRLFRYDSDTSHSVFFAFFGATGWSTGNLTGIKSSFYLWTSTYSSANSSSIYNIYSQKTSSKTQNGLAASCSMNIRCCREM